VFKLKPVRRTLLSALYAFCILFAGLARPMPAAAEPVALPQGPLPTGELAPVELSGISLDGTVAAAPGGVTIDLRSRARLRNGDKKAGCERQMTFPGAAAFDVRVGTQNGGMSPVADTGPWALSLRPGGDAIIEGTQRVTLSGPLADVQLDWAALKPWGAPLAASRLTLRFAGGLDSEQLLLVEPAPTVRDTTQLTWSYEKPPPAGQVRVTFIAPSYWQPVRAARQAASGAQAGAAEHLALAEALRPLADAQGLPASLVTALRSELLAALERAVAASRNDPRPHQELAAYLSARANGDPALLARAVDELKAAHDLAPAGAVPEPPLLAAIDALTAACRSAGDTQGILHALDVLQAVDPGNGPQRAAAYADLAVSQLDAGGQAEAEATIVAGFGQAALDRFALQRPRFRSVTADVETRAGERLMRFRLVPAPGMALAAEADVALLADALGRMGGQVARSAADGALELAVTVPFSDAAALTAAGQAATGVLPATADPALRLVAAVAAPRSIDLQEAQGVQGDRLVYIEEADLGPAQQALQQRLDEIAWARSEAEIGSDDPAEAARRRWALSLLNRYEAGWQALAQGCRVTYRVVPAEDIVAPQWALAWGEARRIAWGAHIPRPERLWPLAVGAAGAVLVLVGIAGLVRRKRKT